MGGEPPAAESDRAYAVHGHRAQHALGETSGGTLRVDPGFSESCTAGPGGICPYGDIEPGWLTPDFVSLTHDHSDHFHYPTLVVKLLSVPAARWLRLGPTSAVSVPGDDTLVYDADRWTVDDTGGELWLTNRVPRLTRCDRFRTGVRGRVSEPGRLRVDG